jgi:hypothetical protein
LPKLRSRCREALELKPGSAFEAFERLEQGSSDFNEMCFALDLAIGFCDV